MAKITIGGHPPPAAAPGPNVTETLATLGRRLKMSEERFTTMRSKIHLLEQNMLSKNRHFYSEFKSVNLELTEIKKEIAEVKDNVLIILKQLESVARSEDFEVLRKYVDYWNPIQFVTKNEIEDIVADVIASMKKQQP